MGNIQSKVDEWNDISERNPAQPNERWTRIFRYVCGALGASSSVLAWYLIYDWLKSPKLGGFDPISLSNLSQVRGLSKGYLNYHILAMSSSVLLLMAPSMITFECVPLSRSMNKDIHNYANTLALLLGLLGFAIGLDYNRNFRKLNEIRTVHGYVGFFVMALLMTNFSSGFLMYVLGYGGKKRGSLKPLHKRVGLFAVLTGMTNILVGLMEKQAVGKFDEKTRKKTHVIAMLVLFAAFNIFCAITKYSDKKDPPQQ